MNLWTCCIKIRLVVPSHRLPTVRLIVPEQGISTMIFRLIEWTVDSLSRSYRVVSTHSCSCARCTHILNAGLGVVPARHWHRDWIHSTKRWRFRANLPRLRFGVVKLSLQWVLSSVLSLGWIHFVWLSESGWNTLFLQSGVYRSTDFDQFFLSTQSSSEWRWNCSPIKRTFEGKSNFLSTNFV